MSCLKACGGNTVKGQDVLNSDGPVRAFGYGVVVFVFLGWGPGRLCTTGECRSGRGTVQVEGDSKPVQHLEGGIVSEIPVSAGDFVTEGQADFSWMRPNITLNSGWSRGVSGRKELPDRLISERDGLDTPKFSSWLAVVEDERASTALENERAYLRHVWLTVVVR